MPPITAEHAAAMVVRGLVEKPARIDTPVGTLADFGTYFTPKLSRRVLHQLYLGYPDSAAARGVVRAGSGASEATGDGQPETTEADRPARRPKRPARSAVAKMRMPRTVKRAVRLVPGVHW
jgi:hypothetical protein